MGSAKDYLISENQLVCWDTTLKHGVDPWPAVGPVMSSELLPEDLDCSALTTARVSTTALFFFQHIHTGPLCQATDMVKGTTAVFIVSVVVPVAFVPQCLHAAIRPQQIHSSLAQPSECTWFLFPRLGGWPVKTDSCPGICLVFSIHLIVVTQGPLVLECLLQITHIIPTGSEIIHW